MSFGPSVKLETEIDELIARYPQKRSASLMVLHALQEALGFLSDEALEWTAKKLELQAINIYELVTFYPMFRQQPVGQRHFKVCRTLSCALSGAGKIHAHLCDRLDLNPKVHGPQTTDDGKFTVEFVECLADCDAAPVMLVNDQFEERVNQSKADELLADD